MSLFVKTEILSHLKAKQRAMSLSRWIQVTEACMALNNFNAVMYIMAGLEDCAIHRLKESWKVLFSLLIFMHIYMSLNTLFPLLKFVPRRSIEKFREIRPLVEARGAYSALRAQIKNSAPPLIPYLGMS